MFAAAHRAELAATLAHKVELAIAVVADEQVVVILHTAGLALKQTCLCHNCCKNDGLREPCCRKPGRTVLNLLT